MRQKPTKLFRSAASLTSDVSGAVLTIGNFDGVHLGHQALISRVLTRARELGAPSLVITFEPHASEYFAKERVTISRLTRMREKFTILMALGVENILILPFNQHITNLTASEFVDHILFGSMKPKHIVIGDDFRFGHARQGDIHLLIEKGRTLGFSVEAMSSVQVDGERVSSTRVRQALNQGDHVLAERLLGRPYSMMGKVRRGDQLGRKLGFPTANIHLHRKLTPVKGVFAVLVHGLGDQPIPGAANVGTRPAVDGTRTLLEVHLLGFDEDIYGKEVRVEFCVKLRDEAHYPSLELLQQAIAKDVEQTRNYFMKHGV